MNGYWDLAKSNPWLAFFLAWMAVWLLALPFKLVNRWIRHRNITASGWPPPHLDADGDVKED
jgi:hypothetical protein